MFLRWGASVIAAAALAGCASGQKPRSAQTQRGELVYRRECAACHGERGINGPIGPSLRGERLRRSEQQIYAIVLDPSPPMPKLYPGNITKEELRDVTAYVESL
jgi:mono/diheme cytochrome c family protein